MSTSGTPDEATRAMIGAVRDAFVAADNRNDADTMTALLADDVVILHPRCGVISGKAAASEFVRAVLAELAGQFHKQARYTTIELHVLGDFAFERGSFAQRLVPRGEGVAEDESGQYFWVYARNSQGAWKIARIAGAFAADESEPCVPRA
jgi:ketosteroid isomerase-like protein